MSDHRYRFTSQPTLRRLARLRQRLQLGPLTVVEAAAVLFISAQMLKYYFDHLHAAGEIHVVGWPRSSHQAVPRYAAGPGVDMPKPAPLTPAQIQQRYRARRNANPAARERYLKKRRATYLRNQSKETP